MHSNNPFIIDYDFDKLINCLPSLANHVFINQYGTKTIKFSDQNAVKELNRALLKLEYNIDWTIPKSNLCPPIPGRLDYLLHINDLVNSKEVKLLDIGTGANLIYPILGTCQFNWKCTGSDVSLDSLKNAQEIINHNKQLSSVKLIHQNSKDSIFKNVITSDDYFDVVICNPPFFKSSIDAEKNNLRKVKNLKLTETEKLNFGGLNNELWCKGGEEEFVKKMVIESVNYKNQVNWFTSLVSNKEHLKNIKRAINKQNPTTVKVVNMEQGNKISRFIAWSFKTAG